MKKIHRAWSVCLGCAILIFVTSGLVANAFSIYLPYILSCNGFTNTQVSSIITARTMTGFIAMFLTGIYYEHIDLRRGMTLAGFFVCGGFFLYGISNSYIMYIMAAIVVGVGYGFGTLVPIGMILNLWFETDLSLALGICGSMTGVSTLGLPSLIAYSVEYNGLGRTFIMESIFIAVMITICYFLLSSSPESVGCEPYRRDSMDKKAAAKSNRLHTRTYKPVIKGWIWILMLPLTLCIGGYTSTAYCHLSVFMTSEGITPQKASVVILMSGLSIMASKLMYGWLAERITTYWSNWVIGSLSAIGLFLCFFAGSSVIGMGISIIIYSFGLGMSTVGTIVWARELSTPEDFEKNNRRIQVGYAAGGLIFSSVPGILADMNHGSYKYAVLLFAIEALFTVLAIQMVYHKAKEK